MLGIWIQFLTVQLMYSYVTSTTTYTQELMYGKEFTVKLPDTARRLDFKSTDASQKTLWSMYSDIDGVSDKERKFTIKSVTFKDEGTYTVINYNGNHFISLLKVIPQRDTQDRVNGAPLRIYMEGLSEKDVTLIFSNSHYNFTLVEHGSLVGRSRPDYKKRLLFSKDSINLLNVSVSDVGNYTLIDGLNRKVKIVSMNLVDPHEGVYAGPFLGLLMLLGIPACVLCCCRKRICNKKNKPTTTISTTNTTAVNQIPPGLPPSYHNPAPIGQTPVYTRDHPVPPPYPGFPQPQPYTRYPVTSHSMPPNPALGHPPTYSCPPAQPPQSHAPPYQPAQSGFAPVTSYSFATPESGKGEIPSMTPLLAPPQPEVFYWIKLEGLGHVFVVIFLLEHPFQGHFLFSRRQHDLLKYSDVFRLIHDTWYVTNRPDTIV